ncbi:UDP-N-acetylmuramoyl-tripeptide--D-alanyl-D-alanine ligase [Robertkochia solimangrovi]|uniref:UDP-N-acetylmuramoyl-tripeptide--D-alanyl-D- alanine ligase n=1 Tax=Robertkochia solimangrovi TaxID=2213046 RepID=UPI0011814990|nr:UDP-N-acetylmuramoyl-tripeptide--D-alanyl-D-alanine ligase [Robertkochia solimangrovi]TRZ44279.1 UDP-N-acetylmuramoyl-tripeptide--D-alanyl-D-alanine ligase [Robertkochia solimangrovi]
MNTIELHKLFLESDGVCTDSRKVGKNTLFFALKGENFNGNEYAEEALKQGACYAVTDEDTGVSDERILSVENVLHSLQYLAAHHRKYLNIPVISLTGSNGKTTTKELINAVLKTKYRTVATKGNLNNHIGVPLTLLSMDYDTEIAIVEMGANHLEEIARLCKIAQPDYGCITNFGKAHLEGFGGVEGVIKGKSELYDYLKNNNKVIFYNSEDSIQVEKTGDYPHKFGFGDNGPDVSVTLNGADPFVNVSFQGNNIKSQMIGAYNYNNIGLAICIGKYFKVADENIIKAIEGYIPDNNRSQIIKKGELTIILDAYNANPSSMKAALENLSKQPQKPVTAIIGDMFELGSEAATEHQAIADLCRDLHFDEVTLVGENFFKTQTELSKFPNFKTLEEAIKNNDLSLPVNGTLLIKGSRGMALERVLEFF